MCGIAGVVSRQGLAPCSGELLKKMCDAMVHRGPDDQGFYFSQKAGLGIRRLSIIDLETGHQPVLNEDGTCAVVLNGEIYNYGDLRRDLANQGHHLATHGDTETIVHLYEQYGDECVSHLRGMFCFALWDNTRQRLLLARDRVGIKQVYYTEIAGQLLFGSEIKCIVEDSTLKRRVRPASLASYLTFLYVRGPATIYEGICELLPAHYLIWEDGEIKTRRYWQLNYDTDRGHSETYYLDGFLDRLQDAVKSHLVADVPLGAFLSGGLDSGTIVALMSQVSGRPAETFTVGFEGGYGLYDERGDARLVAESYRTHHHEFSARPNVSDVLPRIVAALDQPLADSSAVPNYYISKLARSHVKVALSGMGGDELLGGYERYVGMLLGKRYQRLPRALRQAIAQAAERVPDIGAKGRLSSDRLKKFVRTFAGGFDRAYTGMLSTFTREELGELLVGEWAAELRHFDPQDLVTGVFCVNAAEDLVNRMLCADTMGYLPGDLLPLTDRMSMAHSLEIRVPFLDHILLEFAASIPSELKIHRLTKKYLLRKLAGSLLPPDLLSRPKRGFSIPLSLWLRNELKEFVQERLGSPRIEKLGYFNPAKVSSILEEHFAARANHENKIWALVVLSVWHDLYIEKLGPAHEDLLQLGPAVGMGPQSADC